MKFRRGQFLLGAAALREEANAIGCEQWRREVEQATEWREGTCGDQRGGFDLQAFDPAGVHHDISPTNTAGFPEKGALALVGFDKVESPSGGDGENDTREPSARSEIDYTLDTLR